MATEVRELSPSQAIKLPEVNIKKPYPLERELLKRRVDNEFNNQGIRVLRPLKEVKVVKEEKDYSGTIVTKTEDYTPTITANFEYYSRTRALEVSGEKIAVLQNLVNKMTEGTDVMARVVIMNKGNSPDAFVAADGTVFVSQALINCLGSWDEIGAVLAHEVGHLVNKTFEKSTFSGGLNSLGIKWTHELASDATAVYLCEKAGLKSTAFGLAIQNVSGSGRGIEHQAGTMRAAQNIGLHHAVNFSTSAQELQKMPETLRGKHSPTNLEIASRALEKGDGRLLQSILDKLHPRDLHEVYNSITHSFPTDYQGISRDRDPQKYDKALGFLKIGNQLLIKRLTAEGFSQEEILSFMVSACGESRYLITSAKDVVSISQVLEKNSHFEKDWDKAEWFHKMSNKLFGSTMLITGGQSYPINSFLATAAKHMRHQDFDPNGEGVPFTQDSVLTVLDNLKNYFKSGFTESGSGLKVLLNYLEVGFLRSVTESEQELDKSQVSEFLAEVNQRQIFADQYTLQNEVVNRITTYKNLINDQIKRGASEDDISIKNLRILQEALKEWIGYKEKEEISDYRSYIDQNFTQLIKKDFSDFLRGFSDISIALRESFDRKGITDDERLEVARYLGEKIKLVKAGRKVSVLEQADGRKDSYFGSYTTTSEGVELDDRLVHFQLMLSSMASFFPKDSPQFYTFLGEVNQYLGVDWSSLNNVQITNLTGPLWILSAPDIFSDNYGAFLGDTYVRSGKLAYRKTKIEDFATLFSLAPFQELIKKQQELSFSSITETNESLKDTFGRLFVRRGRGVSNEVSTDIFSDDPLSLILFKPHRESLKEVLNQGFEAAQYPSLYDFIQKFMPEGPNKSRLTREIQKRYLTATDIAFADKTEYLVENFESLGPEGALILSEQIRELSVYRYFRAKMQDKLEGLLSGGESLTKLFAADYISSELSRNFQELLSTTISEATHKGDVSTQMAVKWLYHFMKLPEDDQEKVPGTYDKKTGKFLLSDKEREGFKSLGDIFAYLKNLGNSARFGLALKALTDTYGAFSSDKNRESLQNILLKSLNIKPGFVAEVIKAASRKGEARLLGFPAASILARRLFDALDLNSIDINSVKTIGIGRGDMGSQSYQQREIRQEFTDEEIQKILRSDTRMLTTFGGKYSLQEGSLLDREAIRVGHNNIIDALMTSPRPNIVLFATRLQTVQRLDRRNYRPEGGTPLYDQTAELLRMVLAKSEQARADRRTVRTATLLITDGKDEGSYVQNASSIAEIIKSMRGTGHHIIAAMGIDDGETDFRDVFTKMGIDDKWILESGSTLEEIQKACGQFAEAASQATVIKDFPKMLTEGFRGITKT